MATEGVITTNKLIRHLFAKLLPPCRHGPPPSEMEAFMLYASLRCGRVVVGADPYRFEGKLRYDNG